MRNGEVFLGVLTFQGGIESIPRLVRTWQKGRLKHTPFKMNRFPSLIVLT